VGFNDIGFTGDSYRMKSILLFLSPPNQSDCRVVIGGYALGTGSVFWQHDTGT